MDKVWMERGAFLDHEAEFLSNTLKGLAANYTVIMRAAKEEDEVNHLSAMQTRIEEIVKAEFESLKNAFCQEDEKVEKTEYKPKTIVTPEETARKIEANKYIFVGNAVVENTAAMDMLEDAESSVVLEALEEFKGTEISWLNYWDGTMPLSEDKAFKKGDVVYEVITLIPTKNRRGTYVVVVKPTGFAWTIVKQGELAWLGREVK